MIDTVVLHIPREKVREISNLRGIEKWDLHSKSAVFSKFVKNPPRGLNDGIYRPRLTGMVRKIGLGGVVKFLIIEFSVAKLLFGNNLQEPTETDFPKVVELLSDRLLESGLIVSKKDILNAKVATVHPSKNIILTDGYPASLVVKELSKINLHKKFDLTKMVFRNDGKSLQGYSTVHSFVFYDKIADLAKDKKRAIDKDQTAQQLSLFSIIKQKTPSLEVLRFEVRICRKQKLEAILRKIGLKPDTAFKDVFKKEVCQKIVKYYWDTLVKGESLFLFGLLEGPQVLLKKILTKSEETKPKEAMFLVGLNALCKDESGIRGLRSILEKHTKQRNWYRFSDSIKQLNRLQNKRAVFGWVRQIETALTQFQPIRSITGLPAL